MDNPDELISIISGFRLNCEQCESNKFFVFCTKDSVNNTFICSECGNIIHQEELETKVVKDDI